MRAHLCFHTINNPYCFTSKPLSRKHHLPLTIINSTSKEKPKTTRAIGNLQPPWTVPAPSYSPSYDGSGLLLFGQSNNDIGNGIPISLRLVQLRKKRENAALSVDSSALGSVGNAVWALACLIENLQRCTLEGDSEEVVVRVSRDSRYSTVWLFQRVYSSSPEMAVSLISITADFVGNAVDVLVCGLGRMILEAEEEKGDDELGMEERRGYDCWSDIGILEENEKERNACFSYMKKKMAYEKMIVEGKRRNSMVLSNYAQLLYQFEKDLDRAEDYFFWAVTTEPVDSEAMSKYAFFLWHARADTERAEEMFLEAIQADPENTYHHSNYAWFLHQTGGTDTCYPINDCTTINDIDDS